MGPVISVFNLILTLWHGPSSPWGTSDEASPKLSSLFPRSLALYLVPPLLIASHLTVRYHSGLITQSMMLESALYFFSQILLFSHHILSSLLSRLFLNPLPALHPNCYCLVRPSSSLTFQRSPTALWQASQPSVLKVRWFPSRLSAFCLQCSLLFSGSPVPTKVISYRQLDLGWSFSKVFSS